MGKAGQGHGQQQAHKGKPETAEVKAWLKGHGHDAKAVDSAKADTVSDLRALMLNLYGVTQAEYEQAKKQGGHYAITTLSTGYSG